MVEMLGYVAAVDDMKRQEGALLLIWIKCNGGSLCKGGELSRWRTFLNKVGWYSTMDEVVDQ